MNTAHTHRIHKRERARALSSLNNLRQLNKNADGRLRHLCKLYAFQVHSAYFTQKPEFNLIKFDNCAEFQCTQMLTQINVTEEAYLECCYCVRVYVCDLALFLLSMCRKSRRRFIKIYMRFRLLLMPIRRRRFARSEKCVSTQLLRMH